jgi:O-antigen/teichoic acid export membrane protein
MPTETKDASAAALPGQRILPALSTIASSLRGTWKYASHVVSRDHALSLADQAVVSGTSFLTTLLIARSSDAGQLGVYAVGISLLLSVAAFQDSLILQPYMIQRHSQQGTPAEYLSASLTLSVLFAVGCTLALTVTAAGFLEWSDQPDLAVVTLAVAGVTPFALTREFARRAAFARLQIGRALLVDSIVAVVQLSALAWLGSSGRMSAPTACLALGGANAVAAAAWLGWTRAASAVPLRRLQTIFQHTWALGKWLLVGRITVQMQSYVTYWIAMFVAGSAVTGVYAACMSIVNFANPLIFALGNVLTAKLVLAWKDGGGPGLWRESIRNTITIGAVMAAFSLAVFVGGEEVMQFLYHGKEYEGHGQMLTVLALAVFATTAGMPASFGLATMGRPRAIVAVAITTAVLSVILIWLLMKEWGLLGAAYGLLAGNLIGAVGRWIAFRTFIPSDCDSKLVVRALDFAEISDTGALTITRVGGGEQAEVFAIEPKDALPIWGADRALVTKLYRPQSAVTAEMVQGQFNSLLKLHAAIDGFETNGWKIVVPRPLHVCKSPLAFVMTAVPGRNIDWYASRSDALASEMLHGATDAFAAALQRCWSRGCRHSDLGLRNVLFDIETKTISFIDAGTRDSCRTCSEVAKFPSAAASDLGHLLCDVAIDVMDLVGSPERMGREMFVETVLRTVVADVDAENEKRRLLIEIRDCFQDHLSEYLETPSWLLKGISRRVVARVAINRVESILGRVAPAYRNLELEQSQAPARQPI